MKAEVSTLRACLTPKLCRQMTLVLWDAALGALRSLVTGQAGAPVGQGQGGADLAQLSKLLQGLMVGAMSDS